MNVSSALEAPPERTVSGGPLPKLVLDEFAFDNARLRPRHVRQLQQAAAQIARSHQGNQPIVQIVVVGHTDRRGTSAYNWGLGFRRAISAADYLRRILEQRYNRQLRSPLSLRAETEGEFAQVSREHAKNRRVELHFLTQRLARSVPSPYGSSQPPSAQSQREFEYEFETDPGHGASAGQGEFEGDEFESNGEFESPPEGEVAGPSYVRTFSGPNAECVTALTRAGKTRAQALAIINAQIRSAIRMLRVAAVRLKRGNRTARTNMIFRRIFRVPPSFVPTWLKQTTTIRDRGDVVAVRCRRVADLLASGRIRYFCAITATNCPDCGNDNTDFACCSWGSESVTPRNSNVVCLGAPFWDDIKAGNRASTLSTLMHEPFHIYFGKYVTQHQRADGKSVGKFGGINCIVQFVFELNGQTPSARVRNRCTNTAVRSAATGF